MKKIIMRYVYIVSSKNAIKRKKKFELYNISYHFFFYRMPEKNVL